VSFSATECLTYVCDDLDSVSFLEFLCQLVVSFLERSRFFHGQGHAVASGLSQSRTTLELVSRD
jgi:hypothetical protein